MLDPELTFLLERHASTGCHYAAGETVFRRGEPGRCLYLLRAGRIRLERDGESLEELSVGGFFGEMALIEDEARSADAVVLDDAEVVAVDPRQFRFLVQASPNFCLELMRVMARRLRCMNDRLRTDA